MTKQWTADQDSNLADLWKRGYSMGEIADKLAPSHDNQLSRNAVAGRLSRIGLCGKQGEAAPRAERPKTERPKIERPKPGPAPGYRPKPKLARVAPAPAPEFAPAPSSFGLIGVRYLDNTGCTATIHTHGEDGLAICCGRALYYDARRRRTSSFCKTHHDIFVQRTKSDLEYIYGKASSFG
jgi:GcrA cell cycle regulator